MHSSVRYISLLILILCIFYVHKTEAGTSIVNLKHIFIKKFNDLTLYFLIPAIVMIKNKYQNNL